ncbi:MAG TPA: efflux RND transporter periplasmic adaptor subunit [Thermoanaerobaculia bacterium]
MIQRALCILALAGAVSCGSPKEKRKDAEQPEPGPAAAAVPVRTAEVTRANLVETVDAPGKTVALVQQKVRAPFAGTLVELSVVDGDIVHRGQVVGTIVSRESEAALSGAREMAREAHTSAEKEDADRALKLAEKNLVRAPVSASTTGRVLSHAASQGDRVSEDQEILSVEDSSSIVFVADVPQASVSRIRPGQPVEIEIGGRPQPLHGVVHVLLPSANPADFTAAVRIDISDGREPLALGMFGTAKTTVGRRERVLVVPDAALIRDDVSGVTRVAVERGGHARWIAVKTGIQSGGQTEIVSGDLKEGDRVIVSGQVGLPEGAPVTSQK